MLQVLYLNVLKINEVLYLSSRFLLPRLGVFSFWHRLGIRRPLPVLEAGDVWDDTGPAWARETRRNRLQARRSNVRAHKLDILEIQLHDQF
jgi:hypothetical protein